MTFDDILKHIEDTFKVVEDRAGVSIKASLPHFGSGQPANWPGYSRVKVMYHRGSCWIAETFLRPSDFGPGASESFQPNITFSVHAPVDAAIDEFVDLVFLLRGRNPYAHHPYVGVGGFPYIGGGDRSLTYSSAHGPIVGGHCLKPWSPNDLDEMTKLRESWEQRKELFEQSFFEFQKQTASPPLDFDAWTSQVPEYMS